MHRSVARILVGTSALALAACGANNTAIEMKGGDPEIAAVAGDWSGEYAGIESGRTGTAKFSLELGRHTADGNIYMGPSGTPLKISFVAVEKGTINGSIAPYTDPSCQCQVETKFVGHVSGDEIDGTFTTAVVGTDQIQHGTWHVTRDAKK
jgi:hypothetical protein